MPLIVFSCSGRFGTGIVDRFAFGAGAAVGVTALLTVFRWKFNPLLVAANTWLCLEGGALLLDIDVLVRLSRSLQEAAFFLALLVIGTGYVAFSDSGLLPAALPDQDKRLRGSLFLLALIGFCLLWSVVWRGDEQIAAAIPALALFSTQSFLARPKPVAKQG